MEYNPNSVKILMGLAESHNPSPRESGFYHSYLPEIIDDLESQTGIEGRLNLLME